LGIRNWCFPLSSIFKPNSKLLIPNSIYKLHFQKNEMNYYSTNKQSPPVNFKEATILGQAPDKGLYFPEIIPQVEKKLIDEIENLSNEEIAFNVIKPYVGNEIPDDKLFQIVTETVNFPIPLVKLTDEISSLELFHGPTLAFKDVGARFMSRCLGYFLKDDPSSSLRRALSKDEFAEIIGGTFLSRIY